MSRIEFFFEDTDTFDLHEDILRDHMNYLIDNEHKSAGDISIIFCSDDYMLELNKKYLKHDYYTDIITFDYTEGTFISGDLFISADRVRENANHFNIAFTDELNRVIIHGVLHLAGYSDKEEKEKRIMRDKENFYLKSIYYK